MYNKVLQPNLVFSFQLSSGHSALYDNYWRQVLLYIEQNRILYCFIATMHVQWWH